MIEIRLGLTDGDGRVVGLLGQGGGPVARPSRAGWWAGRSAFSGRVVGRMLFLLGQGGGPVARPSRAGAGPPVGGYPTLG